MEDLPQDAQILAERLAEARGISPDEAVVAALRETLARTPTRETAEPRLEGEALIRRMEEIAKHASSLPVLDPRSPEEILGYDEFGVPS